MALKSSIDTGPELGIDPTAESEIGAAAAQQPSVPEALQAWVTRLRMLAGRTLDLAAMETRLAALNVFGMLVVAVTSALCIATAWLGLMAVLALYLVQLGLSWPLALLATVIGNIAIAVIGFVIANRLSHNLCFNALRRLIADMERYDEELVAHAAHAAARQPPPET